jgi:hypothetical protein
MFHLWCKHNAVLESGEGFADKTGLKFCRAVGACDVGCLESQNKLGATDVHWHCRQVRILSRCRFRHQQHLDVVWLSVLCQRWGAGQRSRLAIVIHRCNEWHGPEAVSPAHLMLGTRQVRQ